MKKDEEQNSGSAGKKMFLLFNMLLSPVLTLIAGSRLSLSSEKNKEEVNAIKAQDSEELKAFVCSVLSNAFGVKEDYSKDLITDLRFPRGVIINAIEDMEFRYDFPFNQEDLDYTESIKGISDAISGRIESP